MTRRQYIEKTLRQIYGDFPNDDSSITPNLVNLWLSEGIALAAKQNYKENISIDGIGYVNNGFYTTFKALPITADDQFLWKVELPEIPMGLGTSGGVSSFVIKDNSSPQVSYPVIPLSQNQLTYYRGMRVPPNKTLGYSEGKYFYLISTLLLNLYTAQATLVSGGDSTDLDSVLNVPSDYIPVIDAYLFQQLNIERRQPVDTQNEGLDAITTT